MAEKETGSRVGLREVGLGISLFETTEDDVDFYGV